MIIPPTLRPGDKVGITCPSGYLDLTKISIAVSTLESWGLEVQVGATVGSQSQNYFSETPEIRRTELQQMLDDSTVRAILMGRGGYGMSQIIDELDFSEFQKNPKWICGFSDITLLHNHLQRQLKTASLHSPMCAGFIPKENFDPEDIIRHFKQCLMDESPVATTFLSHPYNRPGRSSGRIVGGNLAMLTHAIGSKSQLKTKGNLLFIEDIGEHLYKIDRMMYQLRRAGMLDGIKGLIFGNFSDTEDTTRPYGQGLYDILKSHTQDGNYPVAFEFPAGHEDINYALKLGKKYELKVDKSFGTLREL